MKRLFFIFILLFSQLSFAELEDYIFEKKEEKNKIRISQELRVTTLDPIKLTDIYSKRAFRFIYDTLFEIDIDGKITPKLAQEYYYITKKHNGKGKDRQHIKIRSKKGWVQVPILISIKILSWIRLRNIRIKLLLLHAVLQFQHRQSQILSELRQYAGQVPELLFLHRKEFRRI